MTKTSNLGLGALVSQARSKGSMATGADPAGSGTGPNAAPTSYLRGDFFTSGEQMVVGALVALSVGASAYHGYKRNHGSLGWGVAWGALGGLFPVITPAIALAQGFGKPE